MGFIRGVYVDPQGGLDDLETLASFLQKLKGKAQTGFVISARLTYKGMQTDRFRGSEDNISLFKNLYKKCKIYFF